MGPLLDRALAAHRAVLAAATREDAASARYQRIQALHALRAQHGTTGYWTAVRRIEAMTARHQAALRAVA